MSDVAGSAAAAREAAEGSYPPECTHASHAPINNLNIINIFDHYPITTGITSTIYVTKLVSVMIILTNIVGI